MERISRRQALGRLRAWAAASLGGALAACGARKPTRPRVPPGFVATNARTATLPTSSWQTAIWGTGQTAQVAYLRRTGSGKVLALSSRCPHAGCPVRYVAQVHRFICPCHGGVFDFDGDVVGGPPPRGMFHLAVIVRDGRVYLSGEPRVIV